MRSDHLFHVKDLYLSIEEMELIRAVLVERIEFFTDEIGLERINESIIKLDIVLKRRLGELGGHQNEDLARLSSSIPIIENKVQPEGIIRFFVKITHDFDELDYIHDVGIPMNKWVPVSRMEYLDLKHLTLHDSSETLYNFTDQGIEGFLYDSCDLSAMAFLNSEPQLQEMCKRAEVHRQHV